MPASAMVGRSGSNCERFAPVTASARSLPARMWGSDEGMLSNIMFTCPPSRSVTAGALPLYGMCSMSTPAIDLNSSPERWMLVPLPLDA